MEHESYIFIFHLKHWNVGTLEYGVYFSLRISKIICTFAPRFMANVNFLLIPQASMSVKIRSPSFSK